MEEPLPQSPVPTIGSTRSLSNDEKRVETQTNGNIGTGDSDHCRICRGDGNSKEPLFYPCKCNGSIRYVHQDCLMQWLSHSQKKHCELCKTPFRFTKFYDPQMPATVPWSIFIRRASIHVVGVALKCARWVLVLFVWLGWVPWCMRSVWRGLFWVGDGSWITQQQLERQSRAISNRTATAIGEAIVSARLSPLPQTTSATWGPLSHQPNGMSPEPFILRIGRRVLNMIIFPYSTLANSTIEIRWVEGPPRNPSLLSNVGLLKSPTRWRFVNEQIIDILEGQLITVGILVTFILMFLIREWVVQQQPMINLGAALEGEAAELLPQADQAPVAARIDAVIDDPNRDISTSGSENELRQQQSSPLEDTFKEGNLSSSGATDGSEDFLHTPSPSLSPSSNDYNSAESTNSSRDFAATRGDNVDQVHQAGGLLTPPESDVEDLSRSLPEFDEPIPINPTDTFRMITSSRPAMPSKEAAAQANNIARTLEEESRLAIEVSNNNSLAALDLAGVPLTNRPSSHQAMLAHGAQLDDDNPLHAGSVAPSLGAGQDQIDHQVNQSKNESVGTGLTDWMWGNIPVHDNDAEDAGVDWQTEADSDDDNSDIDEANDQLFNDLEEHPDPAQVLAEAVAAEHAHHPRPDPEVLRAAAEAGIDANEIEQVEDGEDMDGVMELIGMQGPLAGLLQNGMFSTVIISMTVLFGIWLPYLLGKVVLIVLANPISLLVKMPLRWASTTSDLVVDAFIFFAGCSYYWLDRFVRLTAAPFGWILPFVKTATHDDSISKTAYRLTWSAADRLVKNLAVTSGYFSDSDIPVFSILAHESLRSIQGKLYGTAESLFDIVEQMLYTSTSITSLTSYAMSGINTLNGILHDLPSRTADMINQLRNLKFGPDMLKISFEIPTRTEPLKVSNWTANDRILAILLGYAFFATLGFLYLKARKIFRDTQNQDRAPDGLLVDILNQAGGVFKVILIITIEMLIFPLYCGFLLDTALLPLFSNATISTRVAFLSNSPWTSTFIHWFAGTCYMFHFALFVAMCRKILRTGVLYFIRDPDDPSFHPVRDVLERNVTTQLRKILFSALVYGALVIVCLGAVVWGLSTIVKDVFPIHWSSNEPVLEFPADLLVYNFVMPLAVKFFKPSAGLQDMYNWWFRKCARLLRLSHFLFNERNDDEEGYIVWQKVAADEEIEEIKAREEFKYPVFRDGQFSWQTRSHLRSDHQTRREVERRKLSESDPPSQYKKRFIHDGRMVRAPASDQVRIPKGNKTFVDIDPITKTRKDGLPENPTGLHGKDNDMFSDIYVPPYFRLRIASFIFLIWVFAATTGVSLTVIPLMVGRLVFSRLIQSHPRMNDVYAFAIGFYLLAGPVWIITKYYQRVRRMIQRLQRNSMSYIELTRKYLPKAFTFCLQSLRVVYFYGAFMGLLPSLLGLIWEAYILIPLHTYFQRTDHTVPQHTVHFVSDWTLGVLFIRVAVHVMLKYPQSRPTKALVALVSWRNRGSSWLDPDIRLATRAFIIPLAVVSFIALLLPLGLTQLLLRTAFDGLADTSRTLIYRYSYPVFMAINMAFALLRASRRGINKWRSRVRDEVYLIEERLRNFDDKRGRNSK